MCRSGLYFVYRIHESAVSKVAREREQSFWQASEQNVMNSNVKVKLKLRYEVVTATSTRKIRIILT